MKITVLDSGTLGSDLSLECFKSFGEVKVYQKTSDDEVYERANGSDVVVLNKVKINKTTLGDACGIKLICVTATGYDNVDIDYCRLKGIGVCNVKGYSTDSVAQVTVAMALSLVTHIPEYTRFVQDGSYSASGIQNCLQPAYHEISGMTWGVVGCGNIGDKVARVAEALGCTIIVYKSTPHDRYTNVDIDTLLRKSDIISVHIPLNDQTENLINCKRISMMKKNAVFINVARGAVADEEALAQAIEKGNIGALGVDVYSKEPFPKGHPYERIASYDNVCLTPHMAWGAYEARVRCINEIMENIKTFCDGGIRNRVDLL